MEDPNDVIILILDSLEAIHVEPLGSFGIEGDCPGLSCELIGEGLEGSQGLEWGGLGFC